jgi:hypothetical protein
MNMMGNHRNDPSIPTRPAGQRPPPLRDPNRPATSFFSQPFGNNAFNRGGMSISAGFGFFPLGVTFVTYIWYFCVYNIIQTDYILNRIFQLVHRIHSKRHKVHLCQD